MFQSEQVAQEEVPHKKRKQSQATEKSKEKDGKPAAQSGTFTNGKLYY